MSQRHNHPLPPPSEGLLTQPIISSPAINCILPARLRSQYHNDVVFVGERRIQIKEAHPSGHLEDVVENTDFDGSPLGAKIINVNTHLPWQTQVPSSKSSDHIQDTQDIPPHILFMATDSHELLFMYYLMKGYGRFVSYRRPLPRDVNLSEKYGRHIAVDPKSRAVAVSASRNFFAIYWLETPSELQQQMALGNLNPIKSEKYLQVDGDILFMEFLYPKTINDKRTLLLLIVHKNEATQAMVFEWEEPNMHSHLEPNVTTTHLHSQDYLPSMIIPLAKESSYLLITTRSMAMYTPNSSSRPMRYPPIIPDTRAHQVGIWTRWARPSRNWLYSQRYDGIFLSQEDGWIYYLEFGSDGELETQTSLGQLDCDIDTAFDILDMGYEGGDFILAAGSQGNGGLFIQEARNHPICVQRFINWAPVTDAAVVPSDTQSIARGGPSRDRLFVCSTSASGKGAINELRYGIEARIGVHVSLERGYPAHDLWAMTAHPASAIYLMISDPISSLLLQTTPEMADGFHSFQNEDGWGLEETLAMGCTCFGAMVQVTKNAIHVFVPGKPTMTHAIKHDPDSHVTAAAVDGPNLIMAVATRNSKGNFIHVIRIIKDEDEENGLISLISDSPCQIEKEPICIFLQNWGTSELIFLGTGDGTVLSFEVSASVKEIKQHVETQIAFEIGHDLSNAISSITAIRALSANGVCALLFCGMRSGILVPFDMVINADGFGGLRQRSPEHIGQTPIKLQTQGEIALFTCKDDFWRISFSPDIKGPGYVLSRVWITDQNHPAYFPSRISSFSLLNSNGLHSGVADASLFVYADGELLVCSLDTEDKPVSRRIDIPGNPNKLVYSEHLRSLVVSYSHAENENQQTPLDITRRSYLEFVDPDSQKPVALYNERRSIQGLNPWRPSGSPGENITCIFDWMPEKDGNAYHLIAIGTSIPTPHDPRERKGRIVLLQASRETNSPERIICVEKHMRVCPRPVHAMTAFADSLIVASGKTFLPIASKNSQVGWLHTITGTLPSPAVTMTVHKNLIYVTTTRHSLLTYKIEGGDILPVESDTSARDGLSHSFVTRSDGQPNLTFLSTRGGTVRVFSEADELSAPMPRQTANLPVSILRLVQGCKSPNALEATKSMYGFTINGSVYRLTTLNSKEWSLLSTLVILCMGDGTIFPSVSRRHRIASALVNLENNKHVDGSILVRLLSRGSTFLKTMIDACIDGEFKYVDCTVANAFKDAALEFFGFPDDYVQAIYVWLWNVLRVEI